MNDKELADIIDFCKSSTKWNNQNVIQKRLIKKLLRSFLDQVSGSEMCSMLESILEENEKLKLADKYVKALENVSKPVNNTSIVKHKNKHHFIRPLRLAGLSRNEIKKLGFSCSSTLWTSCINDSERNLGGKPSLPNETITEIKAHLESVSTLASDKTVVLNSLRKRDSTTLEKRLVSARFLQTTKTDAYRLYLQAKTKTKKVSNSSFFKYIDKRLFKNPQRSTDLCDYCEMGKNIQKQVKSFIDKNMDFDQNFNTDTLLQHLKNEPEKSRIDSETVKTMIKKLENLKSIEHHKSTAMRQRSVYNKHRLDPKMLNGKIAIDIDYKQSIVLGQGSRQVNADFYDQNKKKVVCLGFGIYYVDKSQPNKEFVNCLNIDVISDYEGQTASDMIRAFKHVMELSSFRSVDQSEYLVWTDCGKQFRSSEFHYFLFTELAEKNKRVSLNYFVEKHGKNMRDTHFGVVSKALEKSIFKQVGLSSAQEVVDTLNQSNVYLNEDKLANNTAPSISIAVYFNPPMSEIISGNRRIIENIDCYYNLRNIDEKEKGEMKLYSSIFSDCDTLTPVESTIEKKRKQFKMNKNPKDNRITEISNDLENSIIEKNLASKRRRIDCIANQSKFVKLDLIHDRTETSTEPDKNLFKSDFQFGAFDSEEKTIQLVNRSKDIPSFCIYECDKCLVPPSYSIADVNDSKITGQQKVNKELFLHSHKMSLKNKKTGKLRNSKQAIVELLAHYKYAHGIS